MSDHDYPRMEGLEDRCLLSAHVVHVAPPMGHGREVQAVVAPVQQGAGGGDMVKFIRGAWQGRNHHAITTIVTVDAEANTVTVSTVNRRGVIAQTTYNVSPTAVLTIDGASATLDQFIAGINVKLQTDPANPTTVTSIAAIGQQVVGKVTAVDTTAGTITLAGRKGAQTTYTLEAGVAVNVNGEAGGLAGIAPGFEAQIRLSALDSTQVVSVKAEGQALRGAVVQSVDPIADTLTVSLTSRDGTTTQTTVNVSPDAVITIDGQPGKLDQLVPGVKVSLQTDPKDVTTVVSITAVGSEVCGLVSAVDATAGTITLTDRAGTVTTYAIGADVPIVVNGATGTLTDIAVGFRAELNLSALDGTTVIAVEANALRQYGHGRPGGSSGPIGEVLGMPAMGPGFGPRR